MTRIKTDCIRADKGELIMKRPKPVTSEQCEQREQQQQYQAPASTTPAQIIRGLEERIDETTKRLDKALSDTRFVRPSKRLLLQMPLSCSFVLLWLYFGFLRPLEREGRDMHTQQLDPTQILAIPYDQNRLLVFTALTVAAAFLQHGPRTFNDWLSLSAHTFIIMLLAGASVKENLVHTACAAVYWTTLAFLLEPPLLTTRTSFAGNSHDAMAKAQSVTSWGQSTWLQTAIVTFELWTIVFHTTLAVTIVMQLLNLYDRGWQWQRWPVPMIIGPTFGWALGNLIFAVRQVVYWKRTKVVVES